MSAWDQFNYYAGKAGATMLAAGQRAKLRAEIALIDNQKSNRIHAFGVEMYNYLDPLTQSASFWSGDDFLTKLLRGPLIEAQREIKALTNRLNKLKEKYSMAQTKRRATFATKSENWQGTLKTAGKTTVLAGKEGNIRTEIYVVETEILAEKHKFGDVLFEILSKKEDDDGYIATEREVRKIFDKARSDLSNIEKTRKEKDQEVVALGGSSIYDSQENRSPHPRNYSFPPASSSPDVIINDTNANDSFFYNNTNPSSVYAPPAEASHSQSTSMPVPHQSYDPFAMSQVSKPNNQYDQFSSSAPTLDKQYDPFALGNTNSTPSKPYDPFALMGTGPTPNRQYDQFAGTAPIPNKQYESFSTLTNH